MTFTVKPIGTMKSVFHFKNGTPRQASLVQSARGVLTIDKSVFNNPEHSLEGLEEFSHAWIIFIFHKNNNVHTKAKVKPPRLDGQRVGVFSSRSPYRPNNIGLSLAKIDKVKGSSIHFSGIDLVDGTPVLDIKPYIPDYDRPPEAVFEQKSIISDPDFVSSLEDESNKGCKNSENSSTTIDQQKIDHNFKETQDKAPDCKNEFALSKNMESVNSGSKSSIEPVEDTKYSMGATGNFRDENDNNTHKSFRNKDDNLHPVAEGFYELSAALEKAKEKLGGKSHLNDDTEKADENVQDELSDHQHLDAELGAKGVEEFDALDFLVGDIISKAACEITAETFPTNLASDNSFKYVNVQSDKVKNNSCVSKGDSKKHLAVDNTNMKKKKLTTGSSTGLATTQSWQNDKQSTVIAPWLTKPPVSKLNVTFTTQALQQLQLFSKHSPNFDYKLQLLSNAQEAQESISDILKEEPRSVYRRQHCQDSLYYFTVDVLHVTCWFDGDIVQVVRVKPVAKVAKLQNMSTTSG